MSKHAEARQIPMGTCGHKIVRVKYGKVFRWYCEASTCGYDTKLHHIQLAPRGKATR